MKTVTLKIQDDYFDKIISFLEILPKKAVKIEKQEEEKKLKEIEKSIKTFEETLEVFVEYDIHFLN